MKVSLLRKKRKRFIVGLDVSPDNERELLREREFFDAMILAGGTGEEVERKRGVSATNGKTFVRPWMREMLKIAAVVALTVSCGLYFYVFEKKELLAAMNTIIVPGRAAWVNLELPDGTTVWLNAVRRWFIQLFSPVRDAR